MQKRNRHLADNSSRCICFLTEKTGSTFYIVNYASDYGITISTLLNSYRIKDHILEDSIDSITPYFIQNGMETLLARVKGVRAKGRILVVQRSASAGINTQDKFNGPKGIGFLYVREGTPILPLLNGGAQENSLRAGTENVASIVGMATALSMNCSQIQKSQNHSAKMVELICSILNDAEVDYIRNGYSNGLKGTLNLSFRGKDGEAILHRLDLRGILVSTGSACDSNSVQVSHVIKAINVPDSYAKGTIRISLGKDNTIEEAKIIGETLVSVLMEQK